MKITALLKKIGMQEKEILVYINAQNSGLQPASVIAEKVNMNRVTVYIILKRLLEKGFAVSCFKNGIQYFKVESAQKLIDFAKRKEAEWKLMQQKLEEAISENIDIMDNAIEDYSPISVQSLQGFEGVKSILDDTLKAKKLIIYSKLYKKSTKYIDYLEDYYFYKVHTNKIFCKCFFDVSQKSEEFRTKFFYENIEIVLMKELPFYIDVFIQDEKKVIFVNNQSGLYSAATIFSTNINKSFRELLHFIEKNKEEISSVQKNVYSI